MFMQKLEHTFVFKKQPYSFCEGRRVKKRKTPVFWAFFQGGELYEILWFYTNGLQKIQELPKRSRTKLNKNTLFFHFGGGGRFPLFCF